MKEVIFIVRFAFSKLFLNSIDVLCLSPHSRVSMFVGHKYQNIPMYATNILRPLLSKWSKTNLNTMQFSSERQKGSTKKQTRKTCLHFFMNNFRRAFERFLYYINYVGSNVSFILMSICFNDVIIPWIQDENSVQILYSFISTISDCKAPKYSKSLQRWKLYNI